MLRAKTAVLLIFWSLWPLPAIAADFTMTPPREPGARAVPQILGGTPVAKPSITWPATLEFISNGAFCTSTIIGPRVVITAAHCVGDGAHGTIVVGATTANAVCTHHPGYSTDYRLDIALCLTDTAISVSAFERLNTDPLQPLVGASVTLLGFGCHDPKFVDAAGKPLPNIGALFEGTSTVRTAADQDSYVETRGGAAVCYGDSGGGAYLNISGLERRLFGVNSRGDILTRSLLTSVAHPAILRFIQQWKISNGVTICGLDLSLIGCHA